MVLYQQKMVQLFKIIREINVVNQRQPDSLSCKILHRGSSQILLVVKYFTGLVMAVMIVLFLSPVASYLLTGELTDIFPLFSPFFDETTVMGYFGATCFQVIIVFSGALGIASSDVLFMVLVLNVLTLAKLFRARFDELNNLLMIGETAQNSKTVYVCLRNIIKIHQEMCL